ncbi:hypothetical protein D3C77_385050 [compost metagenome]
MRPAAIPALNEVSLGGELSTAHASPDLTLLPISRSLKPKVVCLTPPPQHETLCPTDHQAPQTIRAIGHRRADARPHAVRWNNWNVALLLATARRVQR